MAAWRRPVRSFVLAVALLSLAALLLRLAGLGSKDLWQDEGTSVYYAQLPLQTLYWSLCDPHPPAYYGILRAALVLGNSEWWVRLPSALGGTLAVLLTFVQARVLLRPLAGAPAPRVNRAALLAAALVAVAPLHVWYSQEARPYALLSAAALAMTAAGTWCWLKPGLGRAAIYLLAGWLALSVEYGALATWTLLNLLLLSGWPWQPGARRGRTFAGRWLLLQGLVLAPFALWWLGSAQGDAMARPSYQAVFLAVQATTAGLPLTPHDARWLVIGALLMALLAGLAAALAVRRSQRLRGWLGSPWAGIVFAGLLLLLALWGVAPRLYTVKRHLVVLIPYVAIAAAWVLTNTAWQRPRVARLAGPGLLAVCFVLSLTAIWLVPKSDWREAVETLAAEVRPGDVIWVDEMNAPVFDYYWQDRSPWQPLTSNSRPVLDATLAGGRAWLAGDANPYRNIHFTLPSRFAATHVVAESFDWPGLEVRAYDPGAPDQPQTAPAEALLWGLSLPSPLDIDCR